MRSPASATLILALWLAACEATTPTPTTIATSPAESHLGLFGYQRSILPFTPVAINDSGVIVGNRSGVAVRFFNGVTTVLPAPPVGLSPIYAAVDIAPNGHILGVKDGNILIWTSATALPQVVATGTILQPAGMTDAHLVVGRAGASAFRWTPKGGLQLLTNPPNYTGSRATHVSPSGHIAGFAQPIFSGPPELVVRWDPSGTPTTLSPVANGTPPENRPSDIDNFGNILVSTGGTTVLWGVNGSILTIPGGPTPTRTTGLSSLGRIVGHTIGVSNRPWTQYQGTVTWLPVPTPADQADIPVGVNSCGTIAARRVNGGVVIDSGFVWRKPFTCDLGGVVQP